MLPNGVRVLSETVPGLAAVAIGVWVENGSRYEDPAHNGLSHFLEHLFFKGTARRSAEEIAAAIDAVGGSLNADTDREHTCYYARVLGEHGALAIDVLSDQVLASRLDPQDIAREKEVVLEEIAQIEDTPDDLVQDLFHEACWPEHPLGRPICGTAATVRGFDRAACEALIARRYRPDRIVITAAGKVEHSALVEEVGRRFAALSGSAPLADGAPPVMRAGLTVHRRRLEQVQLMLGTPGVAVADPARDAAVVLNAALGDSPSSRLFQEIRERRGRVYSIESFLCSYRDVGYLGVLAGTRPRWVREVVTAVLAELRRVRREGLTPEELARVKGKLKGSALLGLETADQRMERLAVQEIYLGREVSVAEWSARIDAVTNDQVVALAERLFRSDACTIVLLGDLAPDAVAADVVAALE